MEANHFFRVFGKGSWANAWALVGTTQEVLVEGPDKKGLRYTGRTRGNRIVHFDANERLVGELVPVKIERFTTAVLYGSLVLEE